MSRSEDVNTLFRRFGGDASTYQEIVSKEQVVAAQQRWPMLGQLKPGAAAPAAQRALHGVCGSHVVQPFIQAPNSAHVQGAAAPAPAESFVPPKPVSANPKPMAAGHGMREVKPREVDVPLPPADAAPEPFVPHEPDFVPTQILSSHPVVAVRPDSAPSRTAQIVDPADGTLKSVFDRLLGVVPPPASEPVAVNPLKKLIKW